MGPPRNVVRAVFLLMVGAVLGAGIAAIILRRPTTPVDVSATAEQPLYQCPMHPTITSDHPGDCPICGMKLVRVKSAATPPPASGASERKVLYYRSPMNPQVTSPVPRKDEMGMDYVPVYEDEVQGTTPASGLATVSIDPRRQQLIGLRTAPVVRGAVAGSWRTVGRVEVDPTRVRMVNIKVEGYIERMFVDFVGRPVRRGEPLFSLYSPTVLAAENEYVLALRTRDRLREAGSMEDDGSTLVEAARRRLELWDVPAAEIRRLERTRIPSRTLSFVSPIAGTVTVKNVVQGSRVNVGDTPYEITSLDVVWVKADAYESDLAKLRVGVPARFTLNAYPGRIFPGRVAFIDPLLDPVTRTAKVHVHVANREGLLKPEMFGEVVLESPARQGLRVPADAVVRSGTMDVVFVALGEGRFTPRRVVLGASGEEQIEVRSGLVEGEQVVTRANFLVDSESQLRASLAAISGTMP
jgi:Cu(I)/Ag(I) efflux system membrane fusion protein